MTINVLNKHHGHEPDGKNNIYIGRGSPLGNPYLICLERSREEVIEAYEHHLALAISEPYDLNICDALDYIAEKEINGETINLICFCNPKPCHGDVIKRVIEEKIKSCLN